WKSVGNTSVDGKTEGIELLPGSYSFKMTHLGYTVQQSQVNILEINPVIFETIANGMTVHLLDSDGNGLEGGYVQFYASGWKDLGTTGTNGQTDQIDLLPGAYAFKMIYGGFSQQISQVDINATNPLVFTTINTQARLEKPTGDPISNGIAQYYASGWKNLGVTGADGNTPGLELLPGTYAFKMSYAGYTEQKSNINIAENNQVVFQTVNTENNGVIVQLFDSEGNGIQGGVVQYYASGWKAFGITGSDGRTESMELLPGQYAFKMLYLGFTQQISNVNIDVVNPLTFETIPVKVHFLKSDGSNHLEGEVQYYAAGWKSFGSIENGIASRELLPGKYSFKMTYGGYSQQMSKMDIATGSPIIYQTVNMAVQLKNSEGDNHSSGEVKYYASGWKSFGLILDSSNGEVSKELLPGKYAFKMGYAGYSQQVSRVDIVPMNPLVYTTIGVKARLEDLSGTGLANGLVHYYASGWKELGTTGFDGYTPKFELLSGSYSFKASYLGHNQQQSGISIVEVNPVVFVMPDGGRYGNEDIGSISNAHLGFDVNKLSVYPNPFSDKINIQYSINRVANVKLEVVNIMGQVIEVLFDGSQEAGVHTIEWQGNDHSGTNLSKGLYVIRVTTANNQTSKIIVKD
ncbi:MAG: T9SS type A sorting domain-containing protein, partial [Bacteroidota bacterium]|nr:T9SS type A sorting domain-containing protein [Bacteroidota bacterium]